MKPVCRGRRCAIELWSNGYRLVLALIAIADMDVRFVMVVGELLEPLRSWGPRHTNARLLPSPNAYERLRQEMYALETVSSHICHVFMTIWNYFIRFHSSQVVLHVISDLTSTATITLRRAVSLPLSLFAQHAWQLDSACYISILTSKALAVIYLLRGKEATVASKHMDKRIGTKTVRCAITDLSNTADAKFHPSTRLELPPCSVLITNETLYTHPM